MADWKDVGENDGWADVGWEDVTNDPVRQIPGLEASTDPHISGFKDNSTFLDKARGAVEVSAAAITGIPATIAEAGGQLFFGTKPGDIQEEFYQPRTEKGQEYTHALGEFANRYLNPLMGGIGHVSPPGKRVPKDLDAKAQAAMEEIKRRQAEIDAPKVDPNRRLDINLDEGPNLQKVHVDSQGTAFPNRLPDALERPQRGWEGPMPKQFTPEEFLEMRKQQDILDAQRAIDERQAQMEFEVKKQASLDLNAAERARQERAPIHGMDEVNALARDAALHDPRTLAAEAKLGKVEERAVDSAAYGPEHAKFMEESLKRMEQNVESLKMDIEDGVRRNPIGLRPISSVGRFNKQRGAVNPSMFIDTLHGVKKVGEYTLKLFGRQHGPEVVILDKHGDEVGQLGTSARWRKNDQNLEADFVKVQSQHRGHGLAKEAYKMLAEYGNDVHKSSALLPDGRKMWQKMEAEGIARNGYIPLKQRGAVGNLSKGKKRTIVDDLKDRFSKEDPTDTSFISKDPDPKETIEAAKGEPDSKQWKYTESGGVMAAMKRGSTLVRDGVRFVQNAVKRADLRIRDNVFPTEKALRNLSKEEIVLLHHIMKEEMLQGKRYSPDALDHLSVKQKEAYANMRHMFEDTLRIQNEARAAKGLKPIDEMEAYLSSRWDGDFRRPVYEAVLDRNGNPKINEKGEIEKKLVWYLAADTKRGLEKQWQALKKERPDLIYEESRDHVVKYYKRETDLQSVYSTILDILGRDDPHVTEMANAIRKIEDAIKEQTVGEAATFLGQEKHFKEKTGVRGFVGDRPGKQGTFEEALAMFQQQIQYAKNAYRWSEMQKAGEGLKELFADPDLAKQQPHNTKYLKEYFKNNIGYGEHHAISRLEDSVRGLGFSPTLMNEAVGGAKTFFIMQKLFINAGYMLSGVLQPVNVLPHFTALWGQKIPGNPITASVAGLLGGTSLALGHYGNLALGGKLGKGIQLDSPFYKKAFRYAEDNGVTARSLMDESPIESSFSAVSRGADLTAKLTMVPPEVIGRSVAYMAFVEFLRSSGKFKGNDLALFQKAEELVNASMVDYRAGERPMAFAKLGTIGNFLNTLQTFPANFYNQWNYFGRQLAKGNPMPIMTAFAVQYAMAGAMGVPGFQDMDKLYHYVKDNWLPNSTYAKLREHPFWNDPKVWMMQNFGESSVYGWLSDATGVGLTSRVAAPGMGDMIQSPGGPVVDIAKQVKNLGSAVLDPTNPDKWAQSAMSSVPPGTQGALEQAPFMEGLTHERRPNGDMVPQRPADIQDHLGVAIRHPDEQKLRNFGLRSQRETVERELGYRMARDQTTGRKRGQDMIDEVYAAAKRGDKERVKELYSAYTKLTGNKISKEAWKAQVEQNYLTSMERAGKNAKRLPITDLKNYQRMLDILDEVEQEQSHGR